MLHVALPWSRNHHTLRLTLSFLDQCKFECPDLSALSPALAKELLELELELELEELLGLDEAWYSRAA